MKANWQKKKALFWTTFFLSILGAGASAVAPVRLGPISVVVCVIMCEKKRSVDGMVIFWDDDAMIFFQDTMRPHDTRHPNPRSRLPSGCRRSATGQWVKFQVH